MKKTIYLITILLIILTLDLNGQGNLSLSNCETIQLENVTIGPDENTNLANITLVNTASYTTTDICDQSTINWKVILDIDDDGIIDLEYNSNLPTDDDSLDDTDGNGIPDLYLPPTNDNVEQVIVLPHLLTSKCSHKIIWQVSDACNQGDVCVTSFSIEDKRPPTPYTISQFTYLFDYLNSEIHAQDLDIGSFDNCSAPENLRHSFSPDSIVETRKITCEDVVNSPVDIQVYIWDENGNNIASATTMRIVTDADCQPNGNIQGYIKDWKNEPLENVEVTLSALHLASSQVVYTDSSGYYTFGEHSNYKNYKLTVDYDAPYPTDITTLDLVLIMRYILGLHTLDNPCQLIAADINSDDAIKASDLLELRKLILGVISELPNSTPWKFIHSRSSYGDQINTDDCILEGSPYGHVLGNIEFSEIRSFNFIGIKIGDIN